MVQAGAQSAPATPVHPATSVDMLVALAAVDAEAERRRRLAEQAEKGLDLLESLDGQLEAGASGDDQLRELAAWSEGLQEPEEPELADLLAAVRLRALVELAKRERDGGE